MSDRSSSVSAKPRPDPSSQTLHWVYVCTGTKLTMEIEEYLKVLFSAIHSILSFNDQLLFGARKTNRE